MDWRSPWMLIWLLPSVAFWLSCYFLFIYRNGVARAKFLDAPMADRLMSSLSWPRIVAKAMLQLIAVVGLVIALAGPQFGEQVEEVLPKGSDLYVLLDVSRSMLASDVVPSRLERAKADITSLINSLNGERVGLIAFAGQAVVKCPLTVDYDYFRKTLAGIDVNSAPRGGTAIGDSVRKALQVFSANAQRHQAILLITDGDDHSSAPLEAADYAAERNVKIFAVGLGDAAQGARIPDRNLSTQFMEHDGEQVWSKLDSSLLEQMATRTSGVYIPIGTKSYDLKEVYVNYLAEQESESAEKQTRLRRADQYQWFLAVALIALILDHLVKPFSRQPRIENSFSQFSGSLLPSGRRSVRSEAGTLVLSILLLTFLANSGLNAIVLANDAGAKVQSGLDLYEQEKFVEASQAFSEAGELYRQQKSDQAYLAVFDQACAEHRMGNKDRAIDLYLQAGMARDLTLASKASFNLGKLHVEAAQKLTQEQEIVTAPEKRQEIIESVRQAIAAYRHSLELNPQSTEARRNIELVRQWLKMITDGWREQDLAKRRQELDLMQFLDYVLNVQDNIHRKSLGLKDLHALDQYAELKVLQEELLEELPFLKDKVEDSLNPPTSQEQDATSIQKEQSSEAIKLLHSWVDSAGEQMRTSVAGLAQYRSSRSVKSQKEAIEQLEQIWNAVSPFPLTLQRSLREETAISGELKPTEGQSVVQEDLTEPDRNSDPFSHTNPIEQPEQSKIDSLWIHQQERTLARAKTLAPKAEASLAELQKQDSSLTSENPQEGSPSEVDESSDQVHRTDAAQLQDAIKGMEKAMELAPTAVSEMQSALEFMAQHDLPQAWKHAEEARRILEEIAKNQPKTPPDEKEQENQQNDQDPNESDQNTSDKENPDKQNQDNQNNNEQQQNEQQQNEKKQNEKKQNEKKQNEKNREDKQQDRQQNQSEQKPEASSDKNQKQQDSQSAKEDKRPSQDRISEAMRRVREREAQKRERDRQLREFFSGQATVEKDW